MGMTDSFLAYAAAFEDAYATDDWSKIEPYFTEDAVYETFAEAPFAIEPSVHVVTDPVSVHEPWLGVVDP